MADALRRYHPEISFACEWFTTIGDRDRTTSLRNLGKTNFFTKELDEALLDGRIRIAIHSAKDLPNPLPEGLCVAALTRGVDSRDVLVLRGELFDGMRIATSSERREAAVRALGVEPHFMDVRGTIAERLALLERGDVDGVVIAEAALIRLKLTSLHRLFLPGPTVEGQGQLAIVCRQEDCSLRDLFACLDARRRTLYLGLDPARYPCEGTLIHYPVIQTVPCDGVAEQIGAIWPQVTHVLFTSRSAVQHWGDHSLKEKVVLAIGEGTAALLRENGLQPHIAPVATQEGVIALLKKFDLSESFLLWPRSKLARPLLEEYLQRMGVHHRAIDSYTIRVQKPGSLPDNIDEIVFSSPSTVRAYAELFGTLPKDKKLTPIGPVTEKELCTIYTACDSRIGSGYTIRRK